MLSLCSTLVDFVQFFALNLSSVTSFGLNETCSVKLYVVDIPLKLELY